jgi:tetratricopeptide (TPR) repeat protein
MRPGANAGAVLAAIGAAAIGGAVIRASAQIHGAGPADLLFSISLLALVFGLPRNRFPPPKGRWSQYLVFAPSIWLAIAIPLGAFVAPAGELLSGTLPIVQAVLTLTLFSALWIPAVVARTALQAATKIKSMGASLGASLGMMTSFFFDPMPTLIFGGVCLLLADQVASPTRGWRKTPRKSTPLSAGLAIALTTGSGAMAWTALRGVFDPTPGGLILVGVGLLLGLPSGSLIRRLTHLHPLAWGGATSMLLLVLVGSGVHWIDALGGWIVAQSMGPSALYAPMLGVGLITGIGIGPFARSDKLSWWCAGLGATFGPWVLAGSAGLWIVGTVGLVLSISFVRPISRWAGATLTIIALAAASNDAIPSPSHVGPGILDHLKNPTQWPKLRHSAHQKQATWRAWLPNGTIARKPVETPTTGELSPIQLDLDGTIWRSPSRQSAAEELTGHLTALLAPKREQALVLGDHVGAAVHGLLAHDIGRVDVGIPFPSLLRDIARTDPIREGEWLHPRIRLHDATRQQLIAATASTDAILEIVRTPWADGTGAGMNVNHLDTIVSRLSADGVYVLCTHLNYWPDGSPAALAAALNERFAYVQVWLPPLGADSLIWVSSHKPIPAKRLLLRYPKGAAALDSLGYPEPEALLGSALMSREGISKWAESKSELPKHHRLPDTLFDRPIFHAGALAKSTENTEDIWDMTEALERIPATKQIRDARRLFLEVVDNATRGEVGAAFDTARDLMSKHGDVGRAILEPLIDPHIADAWQSIQRARASGPTSTAWDDAQRFATTARMLAPHSPRPLQVLAEVALVQADVARAQRLYQQILDRDPGHIPALDGMARIGRLRGDFDLIERSLRAATRHAPQDWRTWQNIGVHFLELGQKETAKNHLETAAALAPEDESAPLNGLAKLFLSKDEPSSALVYAERAVRLTNGGTALYLRGRAHFALERYDKAESDFRKAVLADPDQVEARGGIGQIRAMRGDYVSAAAQFRAVLERSPNNAAARENLRRLGPLLPSDSPPDRSAGGR